MFSGQLALNILRAMIWNLIFRLKFLALKRVLVYMKQMDNGGWRRGFGKVSGTYEFYVERSQMWNNYMCTY